MRFEDETKRLKKMQISRKSRKISSRKRILRWQKISAHLSFLFKQHQKRRARNSNKQTTNRAKKGSHCALKRRKLAFYVRIVGVFFTDDSGGIFFLPFVGQFFV